MVWGLIALAVGALYGYTRPGREDKWGMLWKGTILGIVLAIVFAFLGAASGHDALGFGSGLGLFFTVVVLTVLFVVGTWVGDMLESRPRATR
jgi:high-affinity Fe2+/Pb2+ permease